MNTPTLVWEDPGWQQEARGWILAQLAERDIHTNGEIEQPHVRPWSTVMRVPTGRGAFFFKATAPYLGQEAALTRFLAGFRPELFPELLAVDVQRGWMLMGDAGTPLRQYVRAEKSFGRWERIMPLFAQLQKDLAPHASELLEMGVMDRRLERLPALFEGLLADEASMLIDQEESLTSEEYEMLIRGVPEFTRLCEHVKTWEIPASLHHDDFHDGNIFLKDGRVLFTDWGESAVTHPFLSLVVMLRGAGNSLEAFSDEKIEAGPDTPEIVDLRRMYLKEWLSLAPLSELESIARIAERKLGYVNRALTWRHVISHLPEGLRSEYAIAVPAYLKEFLDA